MNDPTQGVGPITYRGRSENNLYTFNHIVVNGNGILKVSTSINSVVHPYSIYYQKQSIGFKTSQDRTSPSSLGFLNADSRTEAYQIRTGCGSLGLYVSRIDDADFFCNLFSCCGVTRYGEDNFL